jgi:hypothetical protein
VLERYFVVGRSLTREVPVEEAPIEIVGHASRRGRAVGKATLGSIAEGTFGETTLGSVARRVQW